MSDRSLLLLLAAIITLGSIATNMYIPALPAVRAYFDAGVVEVQATFAVALVTFAVGILVWGPLSDRFGRRPTILAGIAIVAVGATIGLTAQSLGWLVVGRAVQAFGTSVGIAVSRAIVSDRYPARPHGAHARATGRGVRDSKRTRAGAGRLPGFGLRLAFDLCGAAHRRRHRHDHRLAFFPETRSSARTPPRAAEMAGVAAGLLRKPLFVSCVLQTAAAYSIFLVFISLAPYVMISALGRPPTEYGFYYLFIAVGYVLGNLGVGRLASRGQHWMVVTGVCLQAVGALAALAFVSLGLLHPIWIFAPIAVHFFGQGLFMPNMTATAVSLAPDHAGVGSSTLGFLQQVIGAICVQTMAVHATDTALPLLIFCAVASLLQMLVLWLSPRIEPGPRRA